MSDTGRISTSLVGVTGMCAYRRHVDDPESIAARIRSFEPRSVDETTWAVVGPWVREAVTASEPTLHSQAANALKVFSRLAVWALDQGMELDRETILTPDVLERYRLVGMRELAPTSRSAEMSRLRRIARVVTRRAPWPPEGERGSRRALSPPYSTAEVTEYWQGSKHQHGPFRVQAMKATLALTLGSARGPGSCSPSRQTMLSTSTA
jgi:hypothetical protein